MLRREFVGTSPGAQEAPDDDIDVGFGGSSLDGAALVRPTERTPEKSGGAAGEAEAEPPEGVEEPDEPGKRKSGLMPAALASATWRWIAVLDIRS
ncbi:hypothetical protein AXG93_2142s1000 [Marchantia polymorpha subsp. ruderalis]|uniref:Uncharacterized protein n=1 Tax=Marchantia polymorpha subsp. ruderalis TaxID=1480154 RepID=A0A176WF38_MARPO|nr:hypothetical protein AXG93_2142s1000 [Marchantia polymorpha subsp. ruderalis]